MEGELASLMEVYHLVKNAGRSATLTLSSKKGSASTVRLEIELDDASPSSASSLSFAPSLPELEVRESVRSAELSARGFWQSRSFAAWQGVKKGGARMEFGGGAGQLPRWASGVQRWSACT